MLRLILFIPVSTLMTRTCTSWPTSSSSSTLSTNPSLICVMCTRPLAVASLSGAFTSTKAPKLAILATVPVTQVDGSIPSKGVRSTGSLSSRGAPPDPSRMVKLSLFVSVSALWSFTLTCWPTSTKSLTFSTKVSAIWDTCTRPCACSPLSRVTETKAPNGAMLATSPSNHSPTLSTNREASARARPPPAPSVLPSIMVKPNLPSSRRPLIQTSTCWSSSSSA
mmetsp:Transcript_125073/g.335713  ORF Transcript_125073/g.335713 Transcript_125073/m.335713 type:complete len:223 (-) Transcript_125073:750-1418(-)